MVSNLLGQTIVDFLYFLVEQDIFIMYEQSFFSMLCIPILIEYIVLMELISHQKYFKMYS